VGQAFSLPGFYGGPLSRFPGRLSAQFSDLIRVSHRMGGDDVQALHPGDRTQHRML